MAREEPELDVETTYLDDLDEADPEPVVHRIVSAQSLARPQTRSPRSVFELAGTKLPRSLLVDGIRPGRSSVSPSANTVARFIECHREGGATRCVGGQYPGDRWTQERDERERLRRARQRPPKPTKKAKTRGKKVRSWDGEEQ